MSKNNRKHKKNHSTPNSNKKNTIFPEKTPELVEHLKDLAAVYIAKYADSTNGGVTPQSVTVTLPFEQFDMMKSSILATLFDAVNAYESKAKQAALAMEIAMKATAYSAVDYDFDKYKKIANAAESKSNERRQSNGL